MGKKTVKVDYTPASILGGWVPADQSDYNKVGDVEAEVRKIFRENGLKPSNFKGIYIASASNVGPLQLCIDHDPDVEPPAEATEAVKKYNVEPIEGWKNGEN